MNFDFPGYLGTFDTGALAVYLDEHLQAVYRQAYLKIRQAHPNAKEPLVEIAAWHAVGLSLAAYSQTILGVQQKQAKFYLRNLWRCPECRERKVPLVHNGRIICPSCAAEFPEETALLRGITSGETGL